MSTTKQITVRLPEELVDWVDENLDDDVPSRAAVITRVLRRARRRQQAEQDLLRFLAIERAGMAEEDPEYLEWMRTREFPDSDDEPARVPGSHMSA